MWIGVWPEPPSGPRAAAELSCCEARAGTVSPTRQFGVWFSSPAAASLKVWAGVTSSKSQMAVRVVKRMARALLVFRSTGLPS